MLVSDFLGNAGREWREGIAMKDGEFIRSSIERSYPVQSNLAASLIILSEIIADESSLLMMEDMEKLQDDEDTADNTGYEADPDDSPVDDGNEEGFGLLEAQVRNLKLH